MDINVDVVLSENSSYLLETGVNQGAAWSKLGNYLQHGLLKLELLRVFHFLLKIK